MKQTIKSFAALALSLLIVLGCAPLCLASDNYSSEISEPADLTATDILSPVNPNASRECKNLLAYLQSLKDTNRFVSGTFDISTDNRVYNELIDQFDVETGLYSNRYIISLEQQTLWQVTNGDAANRLLLQHYNNGNILLVHADTVLEAYFAPLALQWGLTTATQGNDMIVHFDATNPDRNMELYSGLLTYEANIDAELLRLEQTGVKAYMFRPWVEFNGRPFNGYEAEGKAAFRRVYQQTMQRMVDYGLTGFLMTYAPIILYTADRYPGNDFVDVLAPTLYSSSARNGVFYPYEVRDYSWYIKTGKPFGLSETSCRTGDWKNQHSQGRSSWYNSLITMVTNWPEVSWVNCWGNGSYSLVNEENGSEENGNNDGYWYLTSPYTINLNELPAYNDPDMVITPPGVVQLYFKENYEGSKQYTGYVGLEQTGYTTAQLRARGIDPTSIGSFHINNNFALECYSGDNYTGTKWTYTEGTSRAAKLASAGKIRSVRVIAASAATGTVGDTVTHSYSSRVVAPTCTEPGYTEHTCSLCGDTYRDAYTQPSGHTLTVSRVKEATCTEEGENGLRCTVCGYSYTQAVMKTGHVLNEWMIVRKPDYANEGLEIRTCRDCGVTVEQHVLPRLADTLPPDGVIRVDKSIWNTLLTTVTFDTYRQSNAPVSITATDAQSGVAKIEYHVSSEAMTRAQLAETDWTEGTALTLTGSSSLVYARLTDNVGNVGYICSDGVVVDTIAPVLSVADGDTLCGNLTVTVTEDNPDAVTVDGEAVTVTDGTFALVGDGSHHIVATDKAGNRTGATVTAYADHAFAETVVAADCTHGGYTEQTCTCCGEIRRVNETQALGHNYNAVRVAATTGHGGYVEYVCTRCGDTYREEQTPAITMAGDADGDGRVTLADLTTFLRYADNPEVTMNAEGADADRNGTINAEDALRIARHLAGWSGQLRTLRLPVTGALDDRLTVSAAKLTGETVTVQLTNTTGQCISGDSKLTYSGYTAAGEKQFTRTVSTGWIIAAGTGTVWLPIEPDTTLVLWEGAETLESNLYLPPAGTVLTAGVTITAVVSGDSMTEVTAQNTTAFQLSGDSYVTYVCRDGNGDTLKTDTAYLQETAPGRTGVFYLFLPVGTVTVEYTDVYTEWYTPGWH